MMSGGQPGGGVTPTDWEFDKFDDGSVSKLPPPY